MYFKRLSLGSKVFDSAFLFYFDCWTDTKQVTLLFLSLFLPLRSEEVTRRRTNKDLVIMLSMIEITEASKKPISRLQQQTGEHPKSRVSVSRKAVE